MKRCAGVVFCLLVGLLLVGASPARAQSSAAADSRVAIAVLGGPTLGHKSSGFFSGELDFALTNKIDLYFEVGHMSNVGTSSLEDNASRIATAIGAQVGSTSIGVNHFDFGIKFHITPPTEKVHPYVILGVGAARTTTEVTFTVNGQPFDPAGVVALGGDLSGTNTKTILTFGGGLMFPFANRYFADFGYRFGGILSKVSDIENDITIKSQRITLGAGVRF